MKRAYTAPSLTTRTAPLRPQDSEILRSVVMCCSHSSPSSLDMIVRGLASPPLNFALNRGRRRRAVASSTLSRLPPTKPPTQHSPFLPRGAGNEACRAIPGVTLLPPMRRAAHSSPAPPASRARQSRANCSFFSLRDVFSACSCASSPRSEECACCASSRSRCSMRACSRRDSTSRSLAYRACCSLRMQVVTASSCSVIASRRCLSEWRAESEVPVSPSALPVILSREKREPRSCRLAAGSWDSACDAPCEPPWDPPPAALPSAQPSTDDPAAPLPAPPPAPPQASFANPSGWISPSAGSAAESFSAVNASRLSARGIGPPPTADCRAASSAGKLAWWPRGVSLKVARSKSVCSPPSSLSLLDESCSSTARISAARLASTVGGAAPLTCCAAHAASSSSNEPPSSARSSSELPRVMRGRRIRSSSPGMSGPSSSPPSSSCDCSGSPGASIPCIDASLNSGRHVRVASGGLRGCCFFLAPPLCGVGIGLTRLRAASASAPDGNATEEGEPGRSRAEGLPGRMGLPARMGLAARVGEAGADGRGLRGDATLRGAAPLGELSIFP
mmetsp:Transcript_49259/g.110812  ORF Transcript_49259/g.110812 Transcript_49259/m.110812 type:complete len:562 (-) Transcript_49259:205-1890(-)